MNDKDTQSASAESSSDPEPSSRQTNGGEHPREGWLDRLKVVIGLKPPATVREEISAALSAGTEQDDGFSPEERAMLSNILRLRDVRVDDVMVPRADIEAVDASIGIGELLLKFADVGHSRMPVYRETLDDPIGFVHIKDLVAYLTKTAHVGETTPPPEANGSGKRHGRFDLGRLDFARPLAETELIRKILFVPPSMPMPSLLASMQATHMQMALVIDEYGGTDGVVSLEDVIEMVVGDIEDEYDEDAGAMIVQEGDGVFLADARADLEEVAQAVGTDFALDEEGEDVDTIGGLVYTLIGRIPVRGELITAPGGYEFEILDADPRRIKRLRIYKREPGAPRPVPRRRPRPANEPAEPATGA